jgi:hypothetical protein
VLRGGQRPTVPYAKFGLVRYFVYEMQSLDLLAPLQSRFIRLVVAILFCRICASLSIDTLLIE